MTVKIDRKSKVGIQDDGRLSITYRAGGKTVVVPDLDAVKLLNAIGKALFEIRAMEADPMHGHD